MQALIAIPAALQRYPRLATRYTTAHQNMLAWKGVRARAPGVMPGWLINGVSNVLGVYWFLVPERGLLAKLENLRGLRSKLRVLSSKLPMDVADQQQNGHVLVSPATAKACLKLFEDLIMKRDSQAMRDALGEPGRYTVIEGLQPLAKMFARDTLKTDLQGRVIVRAACYQEAISTLDDQVHLLTHMIKSLDPSDLQREYTREAVGV
jgi:hypothetical protein